ncbi:MAG TPA: hypothetical protein VGA03_12065 [Anaerolineales bacterium]
MEKGSAPQEFRPERIPRRGELVAWACTLLVGGGWFWLARSGQGVNLMVPLLAIPLLLAALSISLGNWMDRATRLQLSREGIAFQNGLRRVRLAWDEIQQVQVTPAHWGKRVEVVGVETHFRFYTLGEVKMAGRVKGRTGFAAGELILKRILERGNLRQGSQPDANRQDPGYYYFTRE